MTSETASCGYLAGLYLRLSEKDKGEAESESIENQRSLLLQEAEKRGFQVVDCYIDDGFTGTNFHRPGFERMIADIERGKINLVMTKDLSRFGRNYAQAGYYQEEYFPERQVRYLAVLDGYDSANEYTTVSAPWMNVANEQYAKDISRKIRGAFRAKMESGQFVGAFAPYGYRKDPQNKNRLIVEEKSASVVRRIFSMLIEEMLPSDIAGILNAEKIPTPAQYRRLQSEHTDNPPVSSEWTASSITKLTRSRVYIGDVVHNRQRKASYKSKTYLQNAKENWIINVSVHEPIVSREAFETAQRIKGARKRREGSGFHNLFSGFVFCADCRHAMSASPTRKWREGVYNLSCGAYKLYGTKRCTNHFICYDHLKAILYREISFRILALSKAEWEEIGIALQARLTDEAVRDRPFTSKIYKWRQEMNEIDQIIQNLYEDRLNGTISEERFEKLLKSYEGRQAQLARDIEESEAAVCTHARPCPHVSSPSFFSLAKRIILPEGLTREMLYAFIDQIVIYQGKSEEMDAKRIKRQKIEIHSKYR